MKEKVYGQVLQAVEAMVAGETDRIAVMSTICCELYHAFDYFNWVGFYRRVDDRTLKVGPYQGGHGCLVIDRDRGVCGACFREGAIQLENDVTRARDHIACSSSTKAEIVVPVLDAGGHVVAVLDVDSIAPDVFDTTDAKSLQALAGLVSPLYS